MRAPRIAFAASIGLALAGGCSSSKCAPGTLALTLHLLDTTPAADTITVAGNDPGAAVSESFPHTPNPSVASENATVVVTWPQGFPANAAVHLTIDAIAGGQVIGTGEDDVNLGKSCSVGEAFVGAISGALDGGADGSS